MDEFVKTKLSEWDLESLLTVFQENAVDEEVFNALNDEMIKDLVPQIGLRYKFSNKYKAYMASIMPVMDENTLQNQDKDQALSDTLSESTTVSIASTSSTSVSEVSRKIKSTRKSVKELLSEDPKGKEIMSQFRTCGNIDQSKLAALLVDRELAEDPDTRITAAVFRTWAQSIAEIFPNERAETYYAPYTAGDKGPISASGILWNRYLNTRRVFRKIGMITKKSSDISQATPSKTIEEALAWLRNNIEPFDTVQEKWKETCEHRINPEEILSIHDYFNTYKCLKLPNGHILIDIDFEYLHGKETNQLLVEWPKLGRQIIKLAQGRKDSDIQALLSLHAALIEKDDVEVLALLVLPLLMNAVSVKAKRSGNHWRPSKLEIQRGFLLHAETVDDLESLLRSRLRILEKYKITNQPLPVIIGPLENIVSCMVLINDTRYPIPSPMKAIDLCFKSFSALNAHYPTECKHVWTFLQVHVYNITDNSTKNYVSVNKLRSSLSQGGQ